MTVTKTCVKCNKQFEITDLEQEIRDKVNAPLPELCPFCRTKERYNKLPMYGFRKARCVYCKKEIVTSVPETETRPIACKSCYRTHFLSEINT